MGVSLCSIVRDIEKHIGAGRLESCASAEVYKTFHFPGRYFGMGKQSFKEASMDLWLVCDGVNHNRTDTQDEDIGSSQIHCLMCPLRVEGEYLKILGTDIYAYGKFRKRR